MNVLRQSSLLTSNITKNMALQNGAPGSLRMTSGYVRKTKPGPLFTTLATSTPCSVARWPKIENVTIPARREVNVFTTQVMTPSLMKAFDTIFDVVVPTTFLLVAVVMKFIIRSKSRKSTTTNAVSEKYLGCTFHPRSGREQLFPLWCYIVQQSFTCSVKRHRSSKKNY